MNLDQLSTDDLAQLKAYIDTKLGSGRSPIKPRQLTDLRLLPSATDPRPTFFMSADSPRDVVITHSPYPALRWHKETGREITVQTAKEDAAHDPTIWSKTPPNLTPETAAERFAREFALLSKEDQTLLIEQEKAAKRQRLQALMGELTESELAAVVGATAKAKKSA